MDVELTRMSPKGQVVIPQGVRDELGIKSGARFAVYGEGETIFFKKIELPSVDDFRKLSGEMSQIAKRRGIRKSDVEAAIREVRARK